MHSTLRPDPATHRPVFLLSPGLWWGLLFTMLSFVPRAFGDVPAPKYRVELEWDANSEPDVAGYKLYFGTASGNYTEAFDAGRQTVATVSLLAETTYYFVVTAYNTEGLESPFSNEVTYTTPQVPELLVENRVPAELIPAGGAPNLSAPAMLAGGSMSFTVSAVPGQRLLVEASGDLLEWACLGTLENPTGEMRITDTDAYNHQQRFYRVIKASAP